MGRGKEGKGKDLMCFDLEKKFFFFLTKELSFCCYFLF